MFRCGARSLVERGSGLDLGPYHIDAERRKFTIELMVFKIEESAKPKANTSLLRRSTVMCR